MQSINTTGVGKINSGRHDRMVSGQESCHEEEGRGRDVGKVRSIKIDLPQPSNKFECSRWLLVAVRELSY